MDYRNVAASLRRKATDSAVGPAEAATLRAKASELEAKYGTATPPPDPPKRTYAPPPATRFADLLNLPVTWVVADIIEDEYRYQPSDYDDY